MPSALLTDDGSLLVFCDGRMFSQSDLGKINPVVRCSTDGGRTWEPMKVLDSAPGGNVHQKGGRDAR
ncbi:MAG: exo-alpha-sialidase, partial [Pirellulales bacterium]|nr:exo-alpha-sialidase [Pirellulales bacterium]